MNLYFSSNSVLSWRDEKEFAALKHRSWQELEAEKAGDAED